MKYQHILTMTASALALAFVVYSCKSNLSEAEKLDLDKIPIQTVEDMFFVNSENGILRTRGTTQPTQ